jgi:hypothetical protein
VPVTSAEAQNDQGEEMKSGRQKELDRLAWWREYDAAYENRMRSDEDWDHWEWMYRRWEQGPFAYLGPEWLQLVIFFGLCVVVMLVVWYGHS